MIRLHTDRPVSRSTIPHGGWHECCLTIRDTRLFDAQGELFGDESMWIVRQDTFHEDAHPLDQWLPGPLKTEAWPVSTLHGLNGRDSDLGGTQWTGISGRPTIPIDLHGRVVGFYVEDAHARYCWLTGIGPSNRHVSAARQTAQVFEDLETALAKAGMDFGNVVRTWFFNDRILDWYDDFNRVRSDFFKDRGIFEGLVPASTGVGMPNRMGSALIVDAFAILKRDESIRIEAVPSPLQCPALDYGSSFSRAVEINTPTHRRLFISGTASIDADGHSVHRGDIHAQIELTMDVIGAILEARGMTWAEAHRSVAYFRQAKDVSVFNAYRATQGLPDLCHVCTHAFVCRDDLLFELELEACKPTSPLLNSPLDL